MDEERLKAVLSQRLRTRRKKMKLTQEKLSEKSGVAVAQISKLERGKCFCIIDTAWQLALALEVRVGWLIGEDIQEPELPALETLLIQAQKLGDEVEEFIVALNKLKN